MSAENESTNKINPNKLKWYEYLACCWPLILVGIGGLLGGLCGGVAYGINANIFSKEISSAKKYIYTTLVGIGAIILYFILAVVLALLFPDLFGA